MSNNKRKEKRYRNIGKVTCSALCVFPGVLLDISLTGCRVRFQAIITPEQDQDYEIFIHLFKKTATPALSLIAHLKWLRPDNATTEIGFSFIHSPGTKNLGKFIQQAAIEDQDFDHDESNLYTGLHYV